MKRRRVSKEFYVAGYGDNAYATESFLSTRLISTYITLGNGVGGGGLLCHIST